MSLIRRHIPVKTIKHVNFKSHWNTCFTSVLVFYCCGLFQSAKCAPYNKNPAMNYLSQYGYLDARSNNQDERRYSTAIEDFQNFSELPVTGKLDSNTLRTMKLARCGVGDKDLGINSKPRFTLQGSRWKVRNLRYKISKYPKKIPRKVVDKEIAKAFSIWSKHTGLTFKRFKGPAVKVHIEIIFVSGEHGNCLQPFDGPGNTLAHAYFPVYGGNIHFDLSEHWTVHGYHGKNIFQVAAHEIGHSLGFEHSKVQASVMAAFYHGYKAKFDLDEVDIKGAMVLYKTS